MTETIHTRFYSPFSDALACFFAFMALFGVFMTNGTPLFSSIIWGAQRFSVISLWDIARLAPVFYLLPIATAIAGGLAAHNLIMRTTSWYGAYFLPVVVFIGANLYTRDEQIKEAITTIMHEAHGPMGLYFCGMIGAAFGCVFALSDKLFSNY